MRERLILHFVYMFLILNKNSDQEIVNFVCRQIQWDRSQLRYIVNNFIYIVCSIYVFALLGVKMIKLYAEKAVFIVVFFYTFYHLC